MKSREIFINKGIYPPILFARVGGIIILSAFGGFRRRNEGKLMKASFFRKFFARGEMRNNMSGLTLIETLIVIAFAVAIVASAAPLYSGFFTATRIDERVDEIVQTLRLAREESSSRLGNLAHGVHFVINPTGPDSYILYEGASYAPSPNERKIELEGALSLSTTLAGNDINFSRGTAVPNTTGTILLIQGVEGTRTVRVNQYGGITKE